MCPKCLLTHFLEGGQCYPVEGWGNQEPIGGETPRANREGGRQETIGGYQEPMGAHPPYMKIWNSNTASKAELAKHVAE